MKVLRPKRRWSYEDSTLVNQDNSISDDGLLTYWAAIDEAIQFWETGKKKVRGKPSASLIRSVVQNHPRNSSRDRQDFSSREHHTGKHSIYTWTKGE